MPSTSESFSPEMIRILKIFGISTIVLVFILSFFNEKRANNSGLEPSEMRIADSERLFFKNIRASSYDLEARNDAKMNIYRHSDREKSIEKPSLNFAIIINRVSDEAYIYVENYPEDLPLIVQITDVEGKIEELTFYGGNKLDHFNFSMTFYRKLLYAAQIKMKVGEKWVLIDEEEKQRDVLKTIFIDYLKLINKTLKPNENPPA
jgi:hypothetical protein